MGRGKVSLLERRWILSSPHSYIKSDKTYRWEFGHTTPQRPPDGYNRFFLGSPLRCCNLTACFHFLYNQASSAILYHYLHQNVPLCIPQGSSQGLIVDKPRCLLECPSVYHRLFPIVRCRRSPRVHSIDRLQLGELRQSTPIWKEKECYFGFSSYD